MAVVMKQFLDRFAAMEKIANETLAANPEALVGVNSLPGSEHDAPVPAEAKKPNEEVTQGQPAGATSAEGAVNGGDAKPLNEGKLEVDQPLENPEQKPLVTDDALTAKEANARLEGIVSDLLNDLKGTQKQASAAAPAQKEASAKPEKKEGEEKKASKAKITLDDETIAKIAAAQATFMAGREAADKAIKQAAEKKASAPNDQAAQARALIKAACIKAAQEQGLDPAAAEAAADNAMAIAGAGGAPAEAAAAAPAEAAAAEAAAAGDAAAAGEAAGDVQLPEDVTEEELGSAIVDLVQSGELDVDTAKALVDEIAGPAEAGVTEDQAAEIIAQGLENGEITPEQAQAIAAAVESGEAADAGAAAEGEAAAATDAEAAGAADAAAAVQDAQDEAAGAAAAEEAMKSAAAHIRANAIQKVASAVVQKRQQVKKAEAKPGSRIITKVAGILQKKVDAQKQAEAQKQASAKPTDADKYIEGFRKQAEAMGVDPKLLAKYVVENSAK